MRVDFRAIFIRYRVQNVGSAWGRWKRQLDDFIERHSLRRNRLLLAVYDDDEVSLGIKVLVLLEMHLGAVVWNKLIFTVATDFLEQLRGPIWSRA